VKFNRFRFGYFYKQLFNLYPTKEDYDKAQAKKCKKEEDKRLNEELMVLKEEQEPLFEDIKQSKLER